MRVLFVTSEIAGLYKRGGLADVIYALPVALSKLGIETAVIMPYYASMKPHSIECVGQMAVDFDGKRELVFVFKTDLSDVKIPIYLIRHPLLNEYDSDSIAATFAFFSACVVRFYLYAPHVMGGEFDIIHCHDWHTALVPLLLGENNKSLGSKLTVHSSKTGKLMKGWEIRKSVNETVESKSTKTILTIHNLMYTGETGLSIIKKSGIPSKLFHVFETPIGKAIKLLREGLDYADLITTVSPTYAVEIASNEKGHIGKVLKARKDTVIGILNGIDPTIWDPEIDPFLPVHYNIKTVRAGKADVKKALRHALKLPEIDVPVFGFVSRIEPRQKGTDLIRKALATLPPSSFQLVILGTGNKKEVNLLKQLDKKYKNFVFINTFDERLARRIYAGSDIMLVPSKFEPCGLTQMIAMRYGTIPLVRKTGGLGDSVKDGKTGFVFGPYTSKALIEKMNEAIDLYTVRQTIEIWNKMITQVMRQDNSWRASAKQYLAMYERLLKN